MLISSALNDPIDVPRPIRSVSGGDPIIPIWLNGHRGVTFQIGTGADRRFAKWAPDGSGIDLLAEVVRLRGARRFATVPEVLDHGHDADGSWMLTASLDGENAVSDRWKARPDIAVNAAGAGIRELHNSLPVAKCPFDWSVERRLEKAQASDLSISHLPQVPAIDQLVVCHGDACVPNTLIRPDATSYTGPRVGAGQSITSATRGWGRKARSRAGRW